MSENIYNPGDLSSSPPIRRRFSAGTVLIPAGAIALHFAIANVVSVLYAFAYAFIRSSLDGGNPFDILASQETLTRLLSEHYPIIATIYCLALIPVYLVYLLLRKRRDRRVLLTEKPETAVILSAAAIMAGAIGVTLYWMSFLQTTGDYIPFIKNALDEYKELVEAFSPTVGYFWMIIGICIMAPIAEELLFRGIIQGELRKAMPEWAAIVIQALLFALYHMQLIQISYVILPGLLLGLLYYWSRSIWVPIIMHVVYNFLGSVLPQMLGDREQAQNIYGIVLTGFILAGIGLLVFLYFRRRTELGAQRV